jgi:hypothetical protein
MGSVIIGGPLYQLLLVMPGMTPAWADWRRQIRHRPNLRNTARERPQLWQRVYCWVGYFGVRDAFTRRLVFATILL